MTKSKRTIDRTQSNLDRRREDFDKLAKGPRNSSDGPRDTWVLVSEKPHFSLYHRPGSQKGCRKQIGRQIRAQYGQINR